jgi:hypothetical protein
MWIHIVNNVNPFRPTILYIEGGILNFGYFKIHKGMDGLMHLTASIIGEVGLPRPNSHIDLTPLQNINQSK